MTTNMNLETPVNGVNFNDVSEIINGIDNGICTVACVTSTTSCDAAGDYRPVAAQGLEVAQLEQVCYRPQPSIFTTLLQDAQPLAVTDAAQEARDPELIQSCAAWCQSRVPTPARPPGTRC